MNYLLYEKEFAELKARGVSLDDLTAAEVVELVKAVERMGHPFRESNLEAAGYPTVLSDGTVLHNLTIGATVWLDEYASSWWSSGSKAYFWAMVYALVNGRSREAFCGEMLERTGARRRIVEMAIRIHATEDELLEGIAQAVHRTGDEKRGNEAAPTDTDWGELLRTLELATGIPAEEWVWGRSSDWCVREFSKHCRYMDMAKGVASPRMKGDLARAANALARIRSSIMRRLGKEVS